MDVASQVRTLVDRNEIFDVLHRYLRGIDLFEWDTVASCFSASCRYHVGVDLTIVGRDDVIDFLADRTGEHERHLGLAPVELFTHTLSNIEVELDGDCARSRSLVMAFVIGQRDGARVMLVRCVRYNDRLARCESGWLIDERQHALQWAYEADPTAVPAVLRMSDEGD